MCFFDLFKLWVQRTLNRLESLNTLAPYNMKAKILCLTRTQQRCPTEQSKDIAHP